MTSTGGPDSRDVAKDGCPMSEANMVRSISKTRRQEKSLIRWGVIASFW